MKSKAMKAKVAKAGAAATADTTKMKKKKSKTLTESGDTAPKVARSRKKSKSTSKTSSKGVVAAAASPRHSKQSSNLKTPPELLGLSTPPTMPKVNKQGAAKDSKKKKRKQQSSEAQVKTPTPLKSIKSEKQSSPATASTVSTKRSETSLVRNNLEAFDLCSDSSREGPTIDGRVLASEFEDSTLHDSSMDSENNNSKKKKKNKKNKKTETVEVKEEEEGASPTNDVLLSNTHLSSPAKKSLQKKKDTGESRNKASKSLTKKPTKPIEVDVPSDEEYGPDNLPRLVDINASMYSIKQTLDTLLLVTNIDEDTLKEITHKKRVEILVEMFKPKALGMAFTDLCIRFGIPYQGLDLDSMFVNKQKAVKAYLDVIFGGKEKWVERLDLTSM